VLPLPVLMPGKIAISIAPPIRSMAPTKSLGFVMTPRNPGSFMFETLLYSAL
jgi:hypothetical protein